jgi:hypothetical protein
VDSNANGTRAYLANWDAGTLLFDISRPEEPRFLGERAFWVGPPPAGAPPVNLRSVVPHGDGVLVAIDHTYGLYCLLLADD